MDLEEVKVLIRSLITSSQVSCQLRHLLRDYKNETGSDLPLFGYRTPLDFLRSIPDTVKLSGGSNPEIFLVESDKSSHVSSLVEGQKRNPKLNYAKSRIVLSQEQKYKDNPSEKENIPRPISSLTAGAPLESGRPKTNHVIPPPPSLMSINALPPKSNPLIPQPPPPPAPSLMSISAQPPQISQPAFNVTKLMQEVQRNPPVMAPYCNNTYYGDFNNLVATRNAAIIAQTMMYANLVYNAHLQSVQNVQNAQRAWAASNFNVRGINNYGNSCISNSTYGSNYSSSNRIMGSAASSSKECELIDNRLYYKEPSLTIIAKEGEAKNSDVIEKPVTTPKEENSVTTPKEGRPVTKTGEGRPVTKTREGRPVTKQNEEKSVTLAVEQPRSATKEEFLLPLTEEKLPVVQKKEEQVAPEKENSTDLKGAAEKNYKVPVMETKVNDSPIESLEHFSSPVNDRVQKKLIEVMKNCPDGLWCCDLPEKYYEIHKSVLDFRDFGYTGLIQMVLELPQIFRSYQPGMGDWLLFDATRPKSDEEAKYCEMTVQSFKVPNYIKSDLLKLLESKEVGIFLEDIAPWYYKMYKKKLDYESLGFSNIKELLANLEGDIVHMTKLEKRILVLPVQKKTDVADRLEDVGESAIPPILPGDDLFIELFPEEAFGPNEKLPALQLDKFLEVGSVIEIVVGEVWTPYRFYVLLEEYQDSCGCMMTEMQNFYNSNLDKYIMPYVTLQPKQVCAAYYNSKDLEDKWHRAEIVKVVNEDKISVNLLDFGTIITITKNHLRFLLKEFGELPIQATLCRLSDVKPPNGEERWPNDANTRFLQLVLSSSMFIEVLSADYEQPRLIVKLFEFKDERMLDVGESLIKEGLAVSVHEVENFSKVENLPKKTARSPVGKSIRELRKIEEEPIPQKKNKQAGCSVGVVQPSIRPSKPSAFAEPERDFRSVVPPANTSQKPSISLNPFGYQPNEEVLQYRSGVRTSVSTISSSSKSTGASHKITASRSYVASESTFSTKTSVKSTNSNATMPPLTTIPPLSRISKSDFELNIPSGIDPSAVSPTASSAPNIPPGLAPSALSPNLLPPNIPPGLAPSSISPNLLSPNIPPGLAPPAASNPPLCAVPPTTGPPKSNIDVLSQYIQALQTQMEFQERHLELIRLKEKQDLEEKKKITNLALHFLTTNSDISAIAQFDPQMALRIATSVAESFYNNTKSTSLLQTATAVTGAAATLSTASITSQVASATAFVSQDVNEAKFYEKEVDVLAEKMLPLNITSPPVNDPQPFRRYIKEEEVEKHTLHVFNIDDHPYLCVDQLLRLYTPFSSRKMVDRILASKKLSFDYKVVNRDEYGPLFEELESYNSFKCEGSDEDYLFLLPLKNATQFLNSLQKITRPILFAFTDLLENFNPCDNYWTVP